MTIVNQLLIVGPLVFLAGFIDSIAGGGGLISLPAYYMAGLPPHLALGTNKFSSCIGTACSTATFIKGNHVYKPLIAVSVIGAMIGSFIGARFALILDEQILRIVMVILVPILAIVIVLKKDMLEPIERDFTPKREQIITLVVSLTIGLYDGFFGPGTGTFLMLAFVGILKLNIITACGNTKVVNLCSNIAAVVAFAINGKIMFSLAIPCAACSILGNYLGSKLAIKNGAKIIKPVMLIVVGLLVISLVRGLLAA